jgi:hypothetical protein
MHDACASKAGATPAVKTADPAIIAAMTAETVHIDALDDDDQDDVIVQETVKTPVQRSQADIDAMSGIFDVTLDGFKKDRDAARAMPQPIIRLKSDEFVTAAGQGRWFKMSPDLYAKLDKRDVGFAFRIQLDTGSIVSKIGRIPSETPAAPVETNPQGTVSAAASRRAATRRGRQTAANARTSQTVTQTIVPSATPDQCKCGRRFNTAGRGERGLCAHCAPLAPTTTKQSARKAS